MALYESWKNRIRLNHEKIVQNLVLRSVLDILISKQKISTTQESHVKEKTTRREQILYFLDFIKDAPNTVLQAFVDALHASNQAPLAHCITGNNYQCKLLQINVITGRDIMWDEHNSHSIHHVSQALS